MVADAMFSTVLVVLLFSSAYTASVIGTSLNTGHGIYSEGSCPAPGDIAPCICLHNEDVKKMDLLCEFIQDEDQLAAVFTANFPLPIFRRFEMIANQNVQVLRTGVFGNVSFESIIISPGALYEVQEGVFEASKDTLQFLDLEFNVISSFPFDDIERLSALQSLNLGKSQLETFPILKSSSLKHLLLASSIINELPVDAFQGVPNLETINMYGLRISDIIPGTFMPLTNLYEVILANQVFHLTHISSGAFTGSDKLEIVNLFGNLISEVEENAFPVVLDMVINLASNRMTIIDEKVWEPYLQNGAVLELALNPLECGCDLTWLYRTPQYLNQTTGNCHEDGEPIQNLNPDWFDDCP